MNISHATVHNSFDNIKLLINEMQEYSLTIFDNDDLIKLNNLSNLVDCIESHTISVYTSLLTKWKEM